MNHSLKVGCSVENLKNIRSFVEKELGDCGLPEEELNLIILAVDEICANVMIHSNSRNPDKELEVRVKQENDGILFEILESGKPFDHSQAEEMDLPSMVKEKRKGGLGLMLVRKIMDSIELRKENSLTIYRLFKRVNPC
jgi:serine/threonine-protein kinase RsbW